MPYKKLPLKNAISSDLFIKGIVYYPQIHDKNGDTWTFFIKKDSTTTDPKGNQKITFTQYAKCEFKLSRLFKNKEDYRNRVKEILQKENFGFTITRDSFEEYFEDRLQARTTKAFEEFKNEINQNSYIKKKETLINKRFENSFNFGGV